MDEKQKCCKNCRRKKQKGQLEDKDYEILLNRPRSIYSLLHEDEFGNEIHYSKRKSRFKKTIYYEPLLDCATKLRDLTVILAESFVFGNKPQNHKDFPKLKNKLSDIWPTAAQLTYKTGLEAIQKYVKTISTDPSLKFYVDLIENLTDPISSTYIYEVKWSMPTKEEPVQMATASMFFSMKNYYLHPSHKPVEVTYVFENSHQILRPGDKINEEFMLMNILQTKLNFIESSDLNIKEICKLI